MSGGNQNPSKALSPRGGGVIIVLAAAFALVAAAPAVPSAHAAPRDVKPYRGLASWVDIYDRGPWRHPQRALRRLDRRGATTLFLQTANYSLKRDIFRPRRVSELLEGAHRRGIEVVAWYVPSFQDVEHDLRRSMKAIRFRSARGETFDSFALDIEADNVRNIARRNARLLRLSDRIRARMGPDYVLGAIVPEAGALYWPGFPYREVARRYDVFVPMSYFTLRTRGPRRVQRFTQANIRTIRKETGDPRTPIHIIGGVASDVRVPEARAFVRAVRRSKVIGASMYDFPITRRSLWKELKALNRKPPRLRPPPPPLVSLKGKLPPI